MVAKSSAPAESAEKEINWQGITDLSEARAALGNVVNISELLGDGSTFYDDKNVFVGKPFLVLDWRFIMDEKTKREYVNVLIMGTNGDKARFNDGSTGIYAQLKEITERVGKVGLEVRGGLRRSDYVKEGVGQATTFYLSV